MVRRINLSSGIIDHIAGISDGISSGVGFAGDDGPAAIAQFYYPQSISCDADGNLYIADRGNLRIRKIATTTGIINTVAGGTSGGDLATRTHLAPEPVHVCVDANKNIFISETRRIRKVDASTGIITTFAGTEQNDASSSVDGLPAINTPIQSPQSFAKDAAGNFYFLDFSSSSTRIRKVDASTGIISTIAGGPNGPVSTGDGGAAVNATFKSLGGIVVIPNGDIFVVDLYKIRKITASNGIITTIAGGDTSGFSGDGGLATTAQFSIIGYLSIDGSGSLYLFDSNNQRLRKIDAATGIVTTLKASIVISGMNCDALGNVYYTDGISVSKLNTSTGTTTQIVGYNPNAPNRGDGGPALNAALKAPRGIYVDNDGDIYIADFEDRRIRKISSSQVINFGELPQKTYGDLPFDLVASASSGLPVTFQSSNPAVATISGNTLTIVGVGTTVISAIQEGNASFTAALKQRTLVVGATLTATADNLTRAYGDPNPALTITYTGFAQGDDESSLVSAPSAQVNATETSAPGTYPITLSGGSDNRYTLVKFDGTLTIQKATLTASPNNQTRKYGQVNPALTISYTGFKGTDDISQIDALPTASTTATILSIPGTYPITVTGGSDVNYNIVAGTDATLTILKGDQVISFGALPTKIYGDAPFPINTSASSGLPVTLTSLDPTIVSITDNIVTIHKAGIVEIKASQAGNNEWNPAPDVSQQLLIRGTQLITFDALPPKNYGDEPFEVSVSSSSGLPVTLTSLDATIASVSGNIITIHKVGTVEIKASQAGNNDWLPAPDVSQQLVINKATQSITFQALPIKNLGDAPFELSATSSVGLPVTFSSALTNVATIDGNMLTITGAGTVTITASQAGNENYLPTQATQTLTVLLPKPTIPSSFIFLVNEFATQVDFLTIPGNGNSRLVVLKKDGPPDFDPVDDTAYTLGQAVGTNNDNMIGLILSGSASSGTIRGLQPGGTYYVEVFEYNTSNGKYSYLTTATATGGQVTMPAQTVSVISPVNNSVNQNTASLAISSSASPGASSYTIELYTNSFFTGTPIVKTGTTTSQTFTNLSYNTQYFTRVKTNLSAEYGPSTTFMTKPAEADAYVTTPANGAAGQQVTLTVTSNAVVGATSYTIELSPSPSFPAGQVISGTSSTSGVSFTDLAFGTLYYTRVKTNLSSVYGEVRTFTTGDALSLSYMTAPSHASTNNNTTLNVTANYLAGATTYIIQLSPDNTFQTGVIEKTSSSRVIAFDDLYYNTRYYVRVSSNLTPGQFGPNVRYFNTRDHVISTPAANATNVNYSIAVTAGTISGASVYTIEVNPSATFNPGTAITRSGSATQSFLLSYNTLYYVRCTSDRATGWGSTRSFTTGSPVTLAKVTAPTNGSTANYSNLSVTVQALNGATNYTVELNSDQAFNPATAITSSSNTNVVVFASLAPSTLYYTRVKTSLDPAWGTTYTTFTTVQSGARVNTVATPEDPVYLADFAVKVYGNPFKERLKLLVTSPEQVDAEITLSDLNGKRIHELTYPSNSFIEIEKQMPNGVYILYVKVGPHVKALRVMKMD